MNAVGAAKSGQISDDIELSGRLARSVDRHALFSLYLAMHFKPADEQWRLQSESFDIPGDPHFPERLNQYRRPALFASHSDEKHYERHAQLIQHHGINDARLHLACFPGALSRQKTENHIDEAVIANCSLPTQMKYHSMMQKDEPLAKELEIDYTLLAETTPASQQIL